VLDDLSKAGFAQLPESLQRAGITVLRRNAHPWIEALEKAIGNAGAVCNAITGWENRWALRNLVDEHPDGVSQRAKNTLPASPRWHAGCWRRCLRWSCAETASAWRAP